MAQRGGAQARAPSDSTMVRAVPVLRDAAVGAAFFAGAAAIAPFDTRLAVASQRPSLQRSTVLRDGADVFNDLGSPGTIVLAAGLYAGGLLGRDRNAAAVGLHALEALAVSGAATEILGGVTGRARPSVDIHRSGVFQFFDGFRSDARASLPSEHVTAAFALASVAAAETSHRWPHTARWLTPAVYTAAALVGSARMYKNQHWASDVLAGAGIGTATGLLVVHYAESHPDNLPDRVLLP